MKRACQVTETATHHLWYRPVVGEPCFCGALLFDGNPDSPALWFEQVSMDDGQGAEMMRQQTARTLEWLWSR